MTPLDAASKSHTSPRLRVVGVSKTYGAQAVHAVRSVSFSVQPGEFVALMGPSGCGKSTLLNMIGAMDTPTEGEIWLDTVNLPQLGDAQLTRIRRERIGFVFQFFNLLSTLTVAENVAVPLELNPERPLQDHQRQERVGQLLETVHLGHRASFFPATLSGGEMQRVAIARALATDPDVILADEPTGNLDSENGLAVLQLLQRISRERGKTILMATHSEEAAQFAHRIIRMRDGQILSDQPVPSAGS